jgi:hypothetical protein
MAAVHWLAALPHAPSIPRGPPMQDTPETRPSDRELAACRRRAIAPLSPPLARLLDIIV